MNPNPVHAPIDRKVVASVEDDLRRHVLGGAAVRSRLRAAVSLPFNHLTHTRTSTHTRAHTIHYNTIALHLLPVIDLLCKTEVREPDMPFIV